MGSHPREDDGGPGAHHGHHKTERSSHVENPFPKGWFGQTSPPLGFPLEHEAQRGEGALLFLEDHGVPPTRSHYGFDRILGRDRAGGHLITLRIGLEVGVLGVTENGGLVFPFP